MNLWATGEREVPGPVAAYLRLLLSLPPALLAKEISKLKGDAMILEGMYSVQFAGAAGTGLAALVLNKGNVYGSDGQVQYDGVYKPSNKPGLIDLVVKAKVPPHVQLVQGYPPQPVAFEFRLTCSFQPGSKGIVPIQTDLGPVNARIEYMRSLPM